MELKLLAEQYIAERDNSPEYDEHLRRTVRSLSNYVGREITVCELEYDLINRWLSSVLRRKSKATAKGEKRRVTTLWFYAAELGFCEWPQSRRIKRIHEPYQVPEAFSKEEVRRLITAAGSLTGRYAKAISRAAYWQALIIAAYDLGFRRGDLFRLPRCIVDGEPFVWVEHKTHVPQCRQLSPQGVQLLRRISHPKLAYPWFRSLTAFRKNWLTIQRRAGVDRGSFKWLRRTHGTYAGTLGHRSSEIFERHYHDIGLDAKPTSPGPL